MRYFLKKCGFQELGSVGDDGKAKRGRYLMISMNSKVLNFFPPLSKELLNDCAVLPVIPLYTGKKTYCNYVYHNSKFCGSEANNKRNEYRIYLNTELEAHQYYFKAQDIMIMRAEEQSGAAAEAEDQTVYFMDVLQDHSSGEYISLSRYIEEYPINGGYAIYDGILENFESNVQKFKDNQISTDIVIDSSVAKRIEQSTGASRANLFNPATFRDFVLAGYGNSCAVTGKKIENALGGGIDVVYIKPRSEGGTCLPSNGLPLDKEISMFFVQGYFTLSDNYEIRVHPDCTSELIKSFDLKQIRVPPKALFQPDRESLAYHRDQIYGSFLKL